jgi:hypothetical protein
MRTVGSTNVRGKGQEKVAERKNPAPIAFVGGESIVNFSR